MADRIRADGVDILVDLAGHTVNGRLRMFARRAAPVQVSYLGYPDTTGLDTMDYRLTDQWADPAGMTEGHYTESLVRLPGGFLSYGPPRACPAPGLPPVLEAGHLTFGSFNNASKLNPGVIALWSDLLKALPDARLLLKSQQLGDAGTRDWFRDRFEANGVSAQRVEFLGWQANGTSHLELYRKVDIGLDPFPYNGTTTTCEALWMGVPVITMAGDRHCARVGVSLLSKTGLDGLIADSARDFVEKAGALAADIGRLRELRAELRERMQASGLTNGRSLAAELEAAYRRMWRDWHGDGR